MWAKEAHQGVYTQDWFVLEGRAPGLGGVKTEPYLMAFV